MAPVDTCWTCPCWSCSRHGLGDAGHASGKPVAGKPSQDISWSGRACASVRFGERRDCVVVCGEFGVAIGVGVCSLCCVVRGLGCLLDCDGGGACGSGVQNGCRVLVASGAGVISMVWAVWRVVADVAAAVFVAVSRAGLFLLESLTVARVF